MRDTLVGERRGPLDRALVLAGSLALVLAARAWVTPAWRRLVGPWVDSLAPGPRLFANHLLVWSLPTAVLAFAAILALVGTGRFRPLSVSREPRRALVDGLVAGAAVIALALAAALATRMRFALHVNPWSIAGNLFSNAWEELFYRALVFTAAWYATGRATVAAVVSGALFGWTHEQYDVPLRVLTGVVGAIASFAYARTGNFVAPWLAHQLADTVLDAIL